MVFNPRTGPARLQLNQMNTTPSKGRGRGAYRRGRGRNEYRGFNGPTANYRPRQGPANHPGPQSPPPPGPDGGGTFGEHPAKDAINEEGVASPSEQDLGSGKQETGGDDVETEVCFICASPVVHNAVAPCNHRTCHICALRLRALYKTRACAHCRVSDFCILLRSS